MFKMGWGILTLLCIGLPSWAGTVKFKQNVIWLEATPNKAFLLDLNTLLEQGEKEELIWSANPLPEWLTLDSPNRTLSGTPTAAEMGSRTFRMMVQDGEAGAMATVHMNVLGPPTAVSDANLGVAISGLNFNVNLKGLLENSEEAVHITQHKMPQWMRLSYNGEVSGTPSDENEGRYEVVIDATNGNGTTRITLPGEVKKRLPEGQRFKAQVDPIGIQTGVPFQVWLNSLIEYKPIGDCDVFSQSPLTPWLGLNKFELFGTAPKSVNGTSISLVLLLDCGGRADKTILTLKVASAGVPPELPHFAVAERTVKRVRLPIPAMAANTEDSQYTFSLIESPAWITLYSDGELELRPERPEVGEHKFGYRVRHQNGFSAKGNFRVTVTKDPQAPVWLEDPIQLEAEEGTTAKASLCRKVQEMSGAKLTFSKISGPAWLKLEGCVLEMAPPPGTIGSASFQVRADNGESSADVTLVIRILPMNHAPVWRTVVMPDAFTNATYTVDISKFVWDPDKDPLTCHQEIGTLPPGATSWVKLTSDCVLSGMPGNNAIGTNHVRVKACDSRGLCASTDININVVKGVSKPQWATKPLKLGSVQENEPFKFDLAPHAKDPDGQALVFVLQSGPEWVRLDGSVLSGTPRRKDVGKSNLSLEVKNAAGGADYTAGWLEVVPLTQPPKWTVDPIVAKGTVGRMMNITLGDYVSNPEMENLQYSVKGPPSFLAMAPGGRLIGTPTSEHLGVHSFWVVVSSLSGSSEANIRVNITAENKAPEWKPAKIRVTAGSTLRVKVSEFVSDPDGDALTFKGAEMPEWVYLSDEGHLVGVPTKSDIGTHRLRIVATDLAGLSAEGIIEVEVTAGTGGVKWLTNPVVLEPVRVNQALNADLTKHCVSGDRDALFFRMTKGPTWAKVGNDGYMVGVPKSEHAGSNYFQVVCSNGVENAIAEVKIEVREF